MRIAMFVAKFPAVSETFIVNQITGLIDAGHDVDIYSVDRPEPGPVHPGIARYDLLARTIWLKPDPQQESHRPRQARERLLASGRCLTPQGFLRGLDILRAPSRGIRFRRRSLLEIAARELTQGPYDVVHCQFGNLGRRISPLLQQGLIHGRLVTSFRGHDLTQESRYRLEYYQNLARHGDLFLPVSQDLANRLVRLGFPPDRIEVLHSGVDCAFFSFAPRALNPGEPVRVATVARMVEMKGITYAIDAIAALVRSGRSVRYDLVGDGPLKPVLMDQIARHGMAEAVEVHGWLNQHDLLGLLRRSHVLLAPSVTAGNGETEGIPNAVKEAMAMGVSVVATRHGGIGELVTHGTTGLLVPERDAAALADGIARLCRDDAARLAMAEAARAKIESDFDSTRLNHRFVRLLETERLRPSQAETAASAAPERA